MTKAQELEFWTEKMFNDKLEYTTRLWLFDERAVLKAIENFLTTWTGRYKMTYQEVYNGVTSLRI